MLFGFIVSPPTLRCALPSANFTVLFLTHLIFVVSVALLIITCPMLLVFLVVFLMPLSIVRPLLCQAFECHRITPGRPETVLNYTSHPWTVVWGGYEWLVSCCSHIILCFSTIPLNNLAFDSIKKDGGTLTSSYELAFLRPELDSTF